MTGVSAPADRATHEPNPQAVSAVPVGIPDAGYELVELRITSYRGSIGGEHYYGRFEVQTKSEEEIGADGKVHWITRGGFGADQHPHDGKSVERPVTAKEAAYLNKKDNEGYLSSPFRMKAGDETSRFDDIQSIYARAVEVFPTLFGPTDILVRETKRHSGIYEVLVGPPEVAAFLAENTSLRDQQEYLAREGYLLKRPAQGIEAATADETGTGSAVGESPVVEDHAPKPSTQTHTTKKKGE